MSGASSVAIGIGGNLGDRYAELAEAVRLLDRAPGFRLDAVSSLFESEPWGDRDQPPFLNAVAVGVHVGSAHGMLRNIQLIEQMRKKVKVRTWGPRVIDLDLLYYGDEASWAEELRLPHPQIANRPFVYLPLAEALELAGESAPIAIQPSAEGRAIEDDSRRTDSPFPFRLAAPPVEQMEFALPSVEHTQQFGAQLARWIGGGEVLALCGPLGAGKSELARSILRAAGVDGPIASPTFTLCREYETSASVHAEHWDFYRIGDVEELQFTGFRSEPPPDVFTLLEWADRFPMEIPEHAIWVTLQVTGEESRIVRVHRSGGLPLRLREPLGRWIADNDPARL